MFAIRTVYIALAALVTSDEICNALSIICIEEGEEMFFAVFSALIDTFVTTGCVTVRIVVFSFSVGTIGGSSRIGIRILE